MVSPKHRIGYIDGLRAVAVLAVVFQHAWGRTWLGQSVGVELFFVLSGLCLSYPTILRLRDNGVAPFDVVRYASGRVVRIIPPYWIAIIATVCLAAILGGPATHVSIGDTVRQALFLDRDVKFLARPFWTLPIEFRWYFLFPICLWLWVKSPRAFLLFLALTVVAVETTEAASLDMVALPAFLLGIVAAHVAVNGARVARFAPLMLIPLVAFAYIASGTRPSTLWELSMFLFVLTAGSVPWLRTVLSVKPLTAIGVASYSIYLVHDQVVGALHVRGLNAPLSALASVAAGFAFWYLCERPFISSPVRDRLIEESAAIFRRWLPRVGVPIFTLMRPASPIGPGADSRRDDLTKPLAATAFRVTEPVTSEGKIG